MSALLAYHNKPALKKQVLTQVRAHRQADEIVQRIYWAEGKGCAVGCLTHDPNGGHEQYETQWGIPEVLAYLEGGIFESLPAEQAKLWPERFLAAIPVGADLTTVWPRFAVWLMIDPEWGLVNVTDAEDVKEVCRKVAAGYEQIIAGTLTDAHAEAIAWAAWAAWAARAARAARAALVAASADKLVELLEAS